MIPNLRRLHLKPGSHLVIVVVNTSVNEIDVTEYCYVYETIGQR